MKISQRMAANHQIKGSKYENGECDSFVINLGSVSCGVDDDSTSVSNMTTSNSRITLQRSSPRKVPQRSIERKINDRDALNPSSTPKGTQGMSTPEHSLSSPAVPKMSQDSDSTINQLPHHQITIKTNGMNTIQEGRLGRRSSFKRTPSSWLNDPKRILLFFATMSSIGTMLLIYFTLSMSKHNEKDDVLDWQ